jgi:hypothetical protein
LTLLVSEESVDPTEWLCRAPVNLMRVPLLPLSARALSCRHRRRRVLESNSTSDATTMEEVAERGRLQQWQLLEREARQRYHQLLLLPLHSRKRLQGVFVVVP